MARSGTSMALAAAASLLAVQGCGGTAAGPSRGVDDPAGTLVFVSGANRLTAVDVANGRRTVRRMASVAACGPELYATRGHVVFAALERRRTVVFSTPVSLDRPPKRLGGAHTFVPSARAGRVWLAGVDCSRRTMVGVRELTTAGRVTRASHRRVPGPGLVGSVEAGLLVQRRGAVAVWDPSTGRFGRRLPLRSVAETAGNLVVGCAPRSRCRNLTIVDAGTSRKVVTHAGRRYRLQPDAELSPDGSLLAASALAGRHWSVAVVNTRDGTSSVVPGSSTGATYPQPSWAASTGWLFFRAPGGRMRAYHPGASRAVTLRVRAPRRAFAFAAG